MGSKEDVEKDRKTGAINNANDSRVGWDSKAGQYFLKDDEGNEKLEDHGFGPRRTVVVFVGASLGPVHRKGVLTTRIDPAAVRVGEGEKLRWIIEDTHDQTDTSEIQIEEISGVEWAFQGASPSQDPEQFKSLRGKKNGKGNDFAETVGGRKPHPNGGGSTPPNFRTKYNVRITFKEDINNASLPALVALIDPDVVYNPPGF